MSLKGIDPKSYTTIGQKRRKVNSDGQYNIPVSNNYEILSDISEDEAMSTSEPALTANSSKKKSPPPIVLYSFIKDHVSSLNDIKKQLSEDILVKYRGNRIILQTKNIDDYKKLKNIIEKAKLEFHTYTPREDKDHKLVIKNLPPSITINEIKEDLLSKNIIVKNVSQMAKKANDNKVTPLPLFIVTVSNQTAFKDIINTKIVCYCVVNWERYKSKNGITQCYKCQAFDHIAQNCFKKNKVFNLCRRT